MKPTANVVWDGIHRFWERSSDKFRSLRIPSSFHSGGAHPAKELGTGKKILDPHGSFLQKWNKIFVLACVAAVYVDPLFFYIPVIDGNNKCLDLDKALETTACVLRTFIDAFYILRIIFQFRTGFIAPSSRVFGRGELVEDPVIVAKRYMTSNFIIDALSILPLPQVICPFSCLLQLWMLPSAI